MKRKLCFLTAILMTVSVLSVSCQNDVGDDPIATVEPGSADTITDTGELTTAPEAVTETAAPDTTADTTADTAVPDTTVPDTNADTTAEETTADTTAPDTTAVTTVPETTVPETTVVTTVAETGTTASAPVKNEPLTISFTSDQTLFGGKQAIIEVEVNDPDATLYYTMNGDIPTEKSSIFPKDGITLKNSAAASTTTARTVRVVAVRQNGGKTERSEVITKTIFMGNNVGSRFNTLVLSITTDNKNLYDDEIGIMVEGNVRKNYINSNPGVAVTIYSPANFRMRGMEWERPAHLEVYDSTGKTLLTREIGIRLHGGASRTTHKQKSLKLIARKTYSPDTGKFNLSFFEGNTTADGGLITEYDRVVVRNSGNDFNKAYIRDEVLCLVAENSGFPDTQAVRPVSVWLNGEYYGSMWLHEVFHDDYFVEKYGGESDKWGIVGGDENEDVNGDEYNKEHINGPDSTVEDYYKMYSYAYKDLTDDEIFAEWCELVDVDNFLRFYALKIYSGDTDWPQHNNKAYRYYPTEAEKSMGAPFDGKWRYLFYDTDFAIGYAAAASDNMLQRILYGDNHRRSSDLLAAVLERDDMKARFAAVICDYMNGAFEYNRFCAVLNALHNERKNEIKYYANANNVNNRVNEIKSYISARPAQIKSQMVSVLGIPNAFFNVEVKVNENSAFTVNTFTTDVGEGFGGQYFSICPITVSAVPKDGYELDYWTVNGRKVTDKVLVLKYSDCNGTELSIGAVMKKKTHVLVVSEISVTAGYDYVVLKNIGTDSYDIGGFGVSDSGNQPARYKLPSCVLGPGESVRLLCNNTGANGKNVLSFNFKVGEIVLVTDRSGNEVLRFTIPELGNKTVYKRQYDGKYIEEKIK